MASRTRWLPWLALILWGVSAASLALQSPLAPVSSGLIGLLALALAGLEARAAGLSQREQVAWSLLAISAALLGVASLTGYGGTAEAAAAWLIGINGLVAAAGVCLVAGAGRPVRLAIRLTDAAVSGVGLLIVAAVTGQPATISGSGLGALALGLLAATCFLARLMEPPARLSSLLLTLTAAGLLGGLSLSPGPVAALPAVGIALAAAWRGSRRLDGPPLGAVAAAVPLVCSATGIGAAMASALASGHLAGTVVAGLLALAVLGALRAALWVRATVHTRAVRLARQLSRPHRLAAHHAREAVLLLESDTTIRFASTSSRRLLGHSPATLVGQRFIDYLPSRERAALANWSGSAEPGEWRAAFPWGGDPRTGQSVEARVVRTGSGDAGLVASVADASEQLALAEQLAERSARDPLTGLANRETLIERIRAAIGHERALAFAVLFIDLDDFKRVNDTLGHAVGDAVLMDASNRLRACVRTSDTIARIGGDEFAALLMGPIDTEGTLRIAERMLAALQHPIDVLGRRVFLGLSVGVARPDEFGAHDAEGLLGNADVAMYAAKKDGKRRIALFEPSMREAASRRMDIEADLHGALERGELELWYQPVVALGSRRIVGFESLLRWHHPVRGRISPAEFIPVAEETGLIVPIGAWALREACARLRSWDRLHPLAYRLWITVNLSAAQLHDPALIDDLGDALSLASMPATRLTLEITESLMVRETEAAVARLDQLKAMGVRLAIDDFGTGYSALGYLRQFPVDYVKVDRSFVRNVGRDAADTALVRAIVALADALHLKTVAEGIERPDQAVHLERLGCRLGQGYLFRHPMPAADIERCLQDAPDSLELDLLPPPPPTPHRATADAAH